MPTQQRATSSDGFGGESPSSTAPVFPAGPEMIWRHSSAHVYSLRRMPPMPSQMPPPSGGRPDDGDSAAPRARSGFRRIGQDVPDLLAVDRFAGRGRGARERSRFDVHEKSGRPDPGPN